MDSRTDSLSAFDAAIARIEAASGLVAMEDTVRDVLSAYPFRAATYAWWSYPPPIREPDYRLVAGETELLSAQSAPPVGGAWGDPLQVTLNDLPTAEGSGVVLRVALLGPRRRFGVMAVALMIGAAEWTGDNYGWRGRFLILAHLVQHRVGLWNPDARPTLGRREIQCLKLAAEGLKAKQIAITLGIGQQTVQFHLSAHGRSSVVGTRFRPSQGPRNSVCFLTSRQPPCPRHRPEFAACA